MIKRLNILFITKWYPNIEDPQSGVFVKKHAVALAAQHNVTLVYIHGLENSDEYYKIALTENDIKEIVVYFKKGRNRITNSVRYLKSFFKALKHVHHKNDLVVANILTRPLVLAFYLKVFKRIPFVVWEHWTGYHDGNYEKQSFLKKWLNRFLVKRAKMVFCVSNHLKKEMKSHLPHKNYHVIPNVVEHQEVTENNAKNDKIIILTAADHADWYKNISGSIKAFSEIVKVRNDFEFHLIGGGKDFEDLQKLANELGLLNKYIFFHGRQPNEKVLEFISKIDFALINSNFETFSVFAIEALVNGKPVIATISGGPEEFINNDNGILIHKNNPQELEKAILKMMDSYMDYDKKILKQSVEKFWPENILNEFNRVYGV